MSTWCWVISHFYDVYSFWSGVASEAFTMSLHSWYVASNCQQQGAYRFVARYRVIDHVSQLAVAGLVRNVHNKLYNISEKIPQKTSQWSSNFRGLKRNFTGDTVMLSYGRSGRQLGQEATPIKVQRNALNSPGQLAETNHTLVGQVTYWHLQQ